MQSFKDQCIELRKKDYSLQEIINTTGRSKTSVYFHIQNIPLSSERKLKLKNFRAVHIRKFALARKGKSARSFKKIVTWTPESVLLVSHLLFDGEIRRKKCVYNNRSTALINRVEKLMKQFYEFEPKRSRDKKTGVTRVAYFNVALNAHLYEKSIELLKLISTMSLDLKRELLRAFFDDEGCMDFRIKTRKVRGYQKDTAILFLVQNLLSDFSINSHIEMPNKVVISGKENLLKFQEEINFSPGVRINGKRPNSLWKKSLEKQKLLKMAIQSYVS